MADWLDEIEEAKKRKRREQDEAWERGRPEREARAALAAACYERNKEAINRTFDLIASYVRRANELTEADLEWTLKGFKGKLGKRGWVGEIEIVYYTDSVKDTFTLWVTYPIPRKTGDRRGPGQYLFEIPINRVHKENISEWVKWVSTGEGSPLYWKDIKDNTKEITPDIKPGGCLYNVWTYIIILGVILLLIYLVSQK